MNGIANYSVSVAKSREQIELCYPIMSQLRPHVRRDEFADKVVEQATNGYKLAFLSDGNVVVAVAGYRISLNLAWGKFLYVDDLVTDEKMRSKGLGKLLLQWLIDEAKRNNGQEFHLDSGIQRKEAHSFYRREGLEISCYHFRCLLR